MKGTRLVAAALALVTASASPWEVVEAQLLRPSEGAPAAIRGLVDPAPQPNGRVLLVFPGWPGIPRIEVKDGLPSFLYLQQHVQEMRPILHAAGISIVTVDCPGPASTCTIAMTCVASHPTTLPESRLSMG